MITDLMLQLVSTLIHWVIAIRPVWDAGFDLTQLTTIVGTALAYDAILPIHEMIGVMSALITLCVSTTFFSWSVKVVDLIAAVIP